MCRIWYQGKLKSSTFFQRKWQLVHDKRIVIKNVLKAFESMGLRCLANLVNDMPKITLNSQRFIKMLRKRLDQHMCRFFFMEISKEHKGNLFVKIEWWNENPILISDRCLNIVINNWIFWVQLKIWKWSSSISKRIKLLIKVNARCGARVRNMGFWPMCICLHVATYIWTNIIL